MTVALELKARAKPPSALRATSPASGGRERKRRGFSSPACGGGVERSETEGAAAPAIAPGRIVETARSWLGTPYRHQASVKHQGADCLGLIRGVWRELYGEEPEIAPPYTPDWNERAHGRGGEPLLEAARRNMRERESAPCAGDVLVFRVVRGGPAKHCGILSEEARFIHAYAGRAVVESWLCRWWLERLAGAFVFPGAEE